MRTLEEQAREYANRIWETEDLTDLSDFTISLESAIGMMQNFARQEVHQALDEAAEKARVRMFHLDVDKPTGYHYTNDGRGYEVNRQSILSLKEKY